MIRTGGSSQIPAFVQMLEQRFGQDKVRAVDTFSSVTSGLGIIGHQIETGLIDAKVYRARDFAQTDRVETADLPAVDFEVLKKFASLTEEQHATRDATGLVGLDFDGTLTASFQPPDQANIAAPRLITAPADAPLLLLTTEYRFLLKTMQSLAGLDTLGLSLAEAEAFYHDDFGAEYVSGIALWRAINPDAPAVLITSTGHFKVFKGDALIPHVEQSVGYRAQRIKGDPFTLLGGTTQIVAFSSTGRAVRLPISALERADAGRLLHADRLIAAFVAEASTQFLLGAPDGTITPLRGQAIPLSSELNTSGTKVFNKRDLQTVTVWQTGCPLWIATNQRVFAHQAAGVPSGKLSLNQDETLVGLLSTL